MKFENRTGLGWAGLVGLGIARLGLVASALTVGYGAWHTTVDGMINRPNQADYSSKTDPQGKAFAAAQAEAGQAFSEGFSNMAVGVAGGLGCMLLETSVCSWRRQEDDDPAIQAGPVTVHFDRPLRALAACVNAANHPDPH